MWAGHAADIKVNDVSIACEGSCSWTLFHPVGPGERYRPRRRWSRGAAQQGHPGARAPETARRIDDRLPAAAVLPAARAVPKASHPRTTTGAVSFCVVLSVIQEDLGRIRPPEGPHFTKIDFRTGLYDKATQRAGGTVGSIFSDGLARVSRCRPGPGRMWSVPTTLPDRSPPVNVTSLPA